MTLGQTREVFAVGEGEMSIRTIEIEHDHQPPLVPKQVASVLSRIIYVFALKCEELHRWMAVLGFHLLLVFCIRGLKI